jgi:hypothetical protein
MGLDVKDIYHDADLLENDRALGCKVRIHEGVLASTVPEVEDEIAKEPDMVLFNVDCCA